MGLAPLLQSVRSRLDDVSFDAVRRHLPKAWIAEALKATGVATVRRRRLPAEQVVWIVLGMAFDRRRSIEEVVSKLDLALPGADTVAPSAIPQARTRLGAKPMAWLFDATARRWSNEVIKSELWRELSLFAIDGTTFRVPDTPENREYFGAPIGGVARTPAAFPVVRVVALVALHAHVIAAASFGPYANDERTQAATLLESIPDDSLTILDRLFLSAPLLRPLMTEGKNRHWLLRARSNTTWRVLEQIGAGDALVEMAISSKTREDHPHLPSTWQMRALEYVGKDGKKGYLLTSLLDAKKYPATEVVAMYRERWEIEMSYDELKNELLDKEDVFRSKTKVGVEQELWGTLLAYNLVRIEMARIAAVAKVKPRRISFITALHLIRDEWAWCAVANPGAIPRHLANLRKSLKRLVLPERRPRSYERVVKAWPQRYPRKKRPPAPPAPAAPPAI